MIYIGIDNGVSGTIGIINDTEIIFLLTPIKHCVNYQKKAKFINRIDYAELKKIFIPYVDKDVCIYLERPMVNPGRFEATASALRAYEATIICLEELNLKYETCDSKEWQKSLLPEGTKGSDNQKVESKILGCFLFTEHSDLILKHKDADGLLIAEWARRKNVDNS